MYFAMRLGALEAVEKLEINPLLPLRNVIRATLIFGEPADASQRKVKVLIHHVKAMIAFREVPGAVWFPLHYLAFRAVTGRG
jgi:hypothetical protein